MSYWICVEFLLSNMFEYCSRPSQYWRLLNINAFNIFTPQSISIQWVSLLWTLVIKLCKLEKIVVFFNCIPGRPEPDSNKHPTLRIKSRWPGDQNQNYSWTETKQFNRQRLSYATSIDKGHEQRWPLSIRRAVCLSTYEDNNKKSASLKWLQSEPTVTKSKRLYCVTTKDRLGQATTFWS